MMGRPLLVMLALAALPLATAAPPEVYAGEGPLHGKAYFDPQLTYDVAYTEPGSTGCVAPVYLQCIVEGQVTDIKWIRIAIEGKGSADFFTDAGANTPTLAYGSCASTLTYAMCIFPLKHETWGNLRMVVDSTNGQAGTVISVYAESGATLFGQML